MTRLFACGIIFSSVLFSNVTADLTLSTARVADTLNVLHSLSGSATLSAFELNIIIIPDGSATGTLEFASAAQPASNYVLGSTGGGFVANTTTTTTTNDTIEIQDFQFPFSGGVVQSGGEIYATLNFTPGPTAFGNFEIYAFDELGARTFWNDEFGDTQKFANVPMDTAPVLIGTFFVPEPSAFLYFLIPIGLVGVLKTLRRCLRIRKQHV